MKVTIVVLSLTPREPRACRQEVCHSLSCLNVLRKPVVRRIGCGYGGWTLGGVPERDNRRRGRHARRVDCISRLRGAGPPEPATERHATRLLRRQARNRTFKLQHRPLEQMTMCSSAQRSTQQAGPLQTVGCHSRSRVTPAACYRYRYSVVRNYYYSNSSLVRLRL